MKTMKKFLALLLALCMIASFAACGGDEGTTTTDDAGTTTDDAGTTTDDAGATGEAVEIMLWTYPVGNFATEIESVIAAFNEVHPEITVKYELLDYQNGDTQVTSAIQGGSAPDLIFEGPERLVGNWGRNDLMVDLSDLWAENGSDIAEGIANSCQLDGTYYMYPLSVAANCMAINYEVFEQADALKYIDDETRTWTTDDFKAAMEAVRDSGLVAVPGIIYCGGQGGDQGTRALVNNLYSDYFVTEDGSSYNANSENNVKALTLLKEMVDSGALNANASFVASDELQAFANQTCAVSFCWNYSNYTSYAEQTQFTPYVVAFPSDDGVPELEMAGPYGFGIFDNGDEAKIAAAKEFIKFVCDDETQGAESVRLTGFFPVHESMGDIYADGENAELRAPYALMSEYIGRYYQLTGGWTEQRTNWWNMLQQIFISGADIQTATDDYVTASNANIG
jgi:multiple sugar transport system substrate-binding protein